MHFTWLIPLIVGIIVLIILWKTVLKKIPAIRAIFKIDEIDANTNLAEDIENVDEKQAKENEKIINKFTD